jgi:enoyl-[acyl-carrier protein] reductase/trans-2-enoyl-CoA reductase (NAD+)
MIIEPKIRGFICTTAHPTGCQQNVINQIDYVTGHAKITGCKNVLIIGCSTGYGLASRVMATFGCDAATLGVMFERPAENNRTASAGWYNTAAFEQLAHAKKIYAKTINGDAFSDEVKQQTIEQLQRDWPDGVDLVIYSLASPRRTDPVSGTTFNSTLKPIGKTYHEKNVNVMTGVINEITVEPANEQEIHDTVKVMGGEDWQRWIEQLLAAGVLAQHAQTVAYSYIGPEMTYPIYRQGTIGKAKEHLEQTVKIIQEKLKGIHGTALISVNKAVVTQASAAIPVVPLYAAILYKVMKAKQIHEGCIEQIYRLFRDYLYGHGLFDQHGFIRLDDLELRADVQAEVDSIWPKITTENINTLTDLAGYRDDFYRLFGFAVPKVDYQADVEP